ncbi:hypothetical protein [Planomonospora sp. ID82291]|uniref:hypothetical protein n=1 Tax=Planomonospora sp. ID82291 TaxID=2738136 RepID=UPI0018C3C9AB|nr:hypothetical protein [Planomonospora sp. ID82291]MBG0819133.1 hypothetical protein [Planomonospora sp. ID82291]
MSHQEQSTPELEDVQQLEEDGGLRVPVSVREVRVPVRVQLLPSRHGVSRSYSTSESDTDPVPLLGADLRRRRATIIATGAAIYVGEKELVRGGLAALWPEGVPLVIEHTEMVYAQAATGTATVSVIAENWAD